MNMIYNGVELPASPKRDGYPCAVIFDTPDTRYLVLFSKANSWNDSIHTFNGVGIGWVQFYLAEGAWEEYASGYDVFAPSVDTLLWANYDVLDTNGNVYLAASEPMVIFAATHTIHADLLQRGIRPRVDAVQGDTLTRRLEFVLTAGGVPWTPPEGTTAALSYIRPDGVGRAYDRADDGAAAYTISGNIIRMTLLPEVLQVAGDVMAVLQIIRKADGKLISTFPVEVAVEAEPSFSASGAIGPDLSELVESVTVVKTDDSVTVTEIYAAGRQEVTTIALGENGYPVSVTRDGSTTELTWEGFD